jgi:hypothetical protein
MKRFIKRCCATLIKVIGFIGCFLGLLIESVIIGLAIDMLFLGGSIILKMACDGDTALVLSSDKMGDAIAGNITFFVMVSCYIVGPLNEWIGRRINTSHTSHT